MIELTDFERGLLTAMVVQWEVISAQHRKESESKQKGLITGRLGIEMPTDALRVIYLGLQDRGLMVVVDNHLAVATNSAWDALGRERPKE